MLLAGVKVPYQDNGQTRYYAIRLVDFESPQNNDFVAVGQFIVSSTSEGGWITPSLSTAFRWSF